MRKQSKRVAATKNAIETAYLANLRETPDEKITVKAVCVRAGINRTTFYKYYDDVTMLADLSRKHLLEEFEETLDSTVPADHSDLYEFLSRIIMRIYRDERAAALPLLYHEPEFRKRVDELIGRYYLTPRYGQQLSEDEFIRISMNKFAVTGLLDVWSADGMTIQPEHICNSVIGFLKRVRTK